jgi:hypothetical protein
VGSVLCWTVIAPWLDLLYLAVDCLTCHLAMLTGGSMQKTWKSGIRGLDVKPHADLCSLCCDFYFPGSVACNYHESFQPAAICPCSNQCMDEKLVIVKERSTLGQTGARSRYRCKPECIDLWKAGGQRSAVSLIQRVKW